MKIFVLFLGSIKVLEINLNVTQKTRLNLSKVPLIFRPIMRTKKPEMQYYPVRKYSLKLKTISNKPYTLLVNWFSNVDGSLLSNSH